MNRLSLIAGALGLRTETFKSLRERSDVFYRGFLVLLFIWILAGLFQAAIGPITRSLRPVSEDVATQNALRGFEGTFRGPANVGVNVEPYIRESIAMGFAISRLPLNAGEAFRSLATVLKWLGEALSWPFSFAFLGYLLLAGLLVHLTSRWLGGTAGIAQMLGLTALAWSPRILEPVSSLMTLAENVSGVGAIGLLNSLLGLTIFVWSTLIYIKATALAQDFSYGKAIGSILLALALGLGGAAILFCLAAAIIIIVIGPLISAVR